MTKTIEEKKLNEEDVAFYRANEKPYGVFSNLSRWSVKFDGIDYPTAEHRAACPFTPSVKKVTVACRSISNAILVVSTC